MAGQNKAIKEDEVIALNKGFASAQAAILTNCSGISVEKITNLRAKLRDQKVKFKVIKNTLASRAVQGTKLEALKDEFKGPMALAYTDTDPVALAKAILEFSQQNEAFSIKIGVLDGSLLTANQVKTLAATPSREVLLGRLAGSLQAPYAGLVYSLSGILRKFVYALDAVRRSKEEKGS